MQNVRGKLRGEGSNDLRKHKPPPSQQTLATSPTRDFVPSHFILFLLFLSFFLLFFFTLPQAQMENILIWSVSLQMREQAKNIIKSSVSFGGGRRSGGGGGAAIGWKLWAAVNYPAPRELHSDLIRADKWQISSHPSESRRTFAFPYYCPDSKCHICSSVFPKRLLFHNIAPPPLPAPVPPPRYQGRSIKAQLMRI